MKFNSRQASFEKRGEIKSNSKDTIYRQDAIDVARKCRVIEVTPAHMLIDKAEVMTELMMLPSAQPSLDEWCDDCKEYDHERHCCPRWNRVIRNTVEDMKAEAQPDIPDTNVGNTDTISRQAAIDAMMKLQTEDIEAYGASIPEGFDGDRAVAALKALPSAQPKEIPKRVIWTGWKGYRDTRYKCPSCEKPVRNDDTYCHRCGQRLMFPNISFTEYVPGQKQDVIVRWDDER